MDKTSFGERLRALRTARGVSLAQVEAVAGISSSFLSLVEQGRSDISIGRLMRLVHYYGVDLGELVADIPTERYVDIQVVRSDDRAVFHSPQEGIDMFLFGHGPSWGLSPVLCVHEPGGSTTIDHDAGVESFMYVIEGEFRFDFGGADAVVLGPGDGAVYRSPGHYTVTNTAPTRGQILAIGAPVEAFKAHDAGASATPASRKRTTRRRPPATGSRRG
jgi:transcriptional regulator with XRE-family HTH domain/mannose-6-phosphate isomerase-like protein (cupin superfamily)